MASQIIDGNAVASQVRQEVAQAVAVMVAAGQPRPGLATVLVGDHPASQVYVRNKHRACAEAGIESFRVDLPATVAQAEVEASIRQLNADPRVHAILLQLPLPAGLDEKRVLDVLAPDKDVDGLHPANLGRLATKDPSATFVPCTPAGCIRLLESIGTRFRGANAVVLGRSRLVGLPVALLLLGRDATVTVCHSRTHDLPAVCRQADILIAAVGRARMVQRDWVRPGAAVIDVGINRVEDSSAKSGHRLVGDVDFDSVREVAGAITPVPGGVGPMTVAMLLVNTLHAAQRALATPMQT